MNHLSNLSRCDWLRCPTACDAPPSGRKQSIRLLACKGGNQDRPICRGGHCNSYVLRGTRFVYWCEPELAQLSF